MKFKITVLFLLILIISSCSRNSLTKNFSTSTYTESQELSIETEDSVSISGNLEFASENNLVIFIAGTGPTDRDCNNNLGLKTDAFKMLASHLKQQGISTFRFDKRSVGKSTIIKESELVFNSFVNDVSEIVKYFENDFNNIILLGHSEGALIGSIVSENKNVKSFISVSGTSKSLDKIVLDQLEKYPKLVPLAENHISEINSGKELSEVNPLLQSLFRPSVIPYLKSVFAINPTEEIAKLNKPIMIINGSCDIQVPIEHAKELHKMSNNSQLVIIENMGHAMKELKHDCSDAMDAYTNAEMELNKKFVSTILEFIKK